MTSSACPSMTSFLPNMCMDVIPESLPKDIILELFSGITEKVMTGPSSPMSMRVKSPPCRSLSWDTVQRSKLGYPHRELEGGADLE